MAEIPDQRDGGGRVGDDLWRRPEPAFGTTPVVPTPVTSESNVPPPHAPQASVPPPPARMPYIGSVFSAVRGVGLAVQIMLGVVSLIGIGEIVSLFGRISLINRILEAPRSVSLIEADQSDQAVRSWSIGWEVAYLATAIVFSVWFFRVRKNAGLWEPQNQRRSQGWSFWGWVCPIVNFWFPFHIASDALESSRVAATPPRTGRVILGFWWGTWLAQFVVSAITRAIGSGDHTAAATIATAKVEIIGDGIFLACGVLAILLVRNLSDLQHRKINTPYVPGTWSG